MANETEHILEIEPIDSVADSDVEGVGADGDVTVVRPRELEAGHRTVSQNVYRTYLVLPAIFLTVTLFGGMRLNAGDNAFLFLKPALTCLVFAALTLVLYFRSGLVSAEGWLSESLPGLKNAANLAVLATMFTATVQLFNALIPEQGLPFWVVGFCFFWTIWNNLFADFDTKRLLRSMMAMFGFAFVFKYLVLANMTASGDASLLQRIFENPAKEAFTWLLDLPRYAAGTGYIQFFTVALYLIGLFLTPRSTNK